MSTSLFFKKICFGGREGEREQAQEGGIRGRGRERETQTDSLLRAEPDAGLRPIRL